MVGLTLPLNIVRGGLKREADTRSAICSFLRLLISTARYTFIPDPEFGFVLNNLRFESVSEAEGIIRSGSANQNIGGGSIYAKKISGTSSNRETFAYELKSAIDIYEKRLTNVRVTMTYTRQNKIIHINIKGKMVEDDSDFQFSTDMKVWN